MPRHQQSIEFDNVRFAYTQYSAEAGMTPPALDNVSLHIEAGEVMAIVGGNGSGKSTLVNLLPRFFDPQQGRVVIDGIDIRSVRLSELRSQMGIVTQETLLFDETIAENIRYGKLDASPEEIEGAAEKARVVNFLDQLPEGLQTPVGEKGKRLSGGQRQRIALARAILRDPSILILDEATSAVDAQSESLIHQALCQFVQGRTTLLITHSVTDSLLELVSRVVVMDEGRVIASGPHETLLQSCPAYQNLYHAQGQRRSA